MNYLNVLISNNTENLFKQSILSVGERLNDLSQNNIIIVPDKLSLYAEQSIFNVLNIDVYFNLSVMGITKFANYILDKNNLKPEQCTNLESKLFILRSIQNVSKDFKCFSKNYTLGFVDEMFTKLEQIKSSRCNIDDLIDENASTGTKLKFEDIKLIYNEYERLRGGKLDGCALLELFNKTCCECEYLKNCNIYFIGFDSLTKQGLQILQNASKSANYTQISVVAPQTQNNRNIYDQTFLDSIINMAKSEKIECETKWLNLDLKGNERNFTLNNLFSRKSKFNGKNEYFSIYKANSKAEEIELCVKTINYKLKTENVNFNDFAICCNEDYHNILASNLQSLGIDVYKDSKYNLFQLEPIKYIFNLFIYLTQKNEQYLINIINNDFCPLNEKNKYELLTELKKFGSVGSFIKYGKNENEEIKDFIEKITSKIDENNYLLLFEKIIENSKISQKIQEKCVFFEKNDEILLNKVFLQIESKLNDVVETLKKLLNFSSISTQEFTNILQKILMETEISSVPSTTNQVFIGDSKSYYFDKKYVFILGFNEGSLPIVLNDYGLISDKEILSPTIKAKLEPTTKIINKRTKFKLFEILTSGTNNCYIYYHSFDQENKQAIKSEFVSELEYLFELQEVESEKLKTIFSSNNYINKLCFNSKDNYSANLSLRSNLDSKMQGIINFALVKNNKLYFKPKQNVVAVDFSKLFFKDNKTSISVIQTYNLCPKSAFLSNGLKLSPIKKDKIEASLVGTFIHKIGEDFVKSNKQNLGGLDENQIKDSVNNLIDKTLIDEKYYSLLLPENKFLLNLIKQEALRFCIFINYEQSVSNFKPVYTEKYFGGTHSFKPIVIDVDNVQYSISGFVDRIDVCEDYFRIIDYKTGNTTNANGANLLYYGTQIQLFVYAKAIKDNINKKLFGAFYLPIKNSFAKNGEEMYSFSGFYEDNVQMAMMCDSDLTPDNPQSTLIGARLNKPDKNGEINIRKANNVFTSENFDAILKYSIEVVKKAVQNINSGFIDCSPIMDKCSKCDFNKICKNAFNDDLERNKEIKISKENFMEIDYGEGAN